MFLTVDIPIVAPSYYDEVARDQEKTENLAFSEQLLINPNARFQITRLDEETPLFKVSNNANVAADPESLSFSNLSAIDGQIHQTKWSRLLGTDLIFDENGQYVGPVREHLVTERGVSVKQRSDKTEKDTDSDEKNDEDVKNDDVKSDDIDTTTAFFKKALAAARAKGA